MKWFDIPSSLVSRLRELQKKDFNYPITISEDAVVMFYGLGDSLYLTFDGRIIIEDMLDEKLPREASNLIEATTAIVVGAKTRHFPELLSILPVQPENAVDCKNCKKSGWFKISETLGPFICGDCGGLGWIL
jgi:hypothetical protein